MPPNQSVISAPNDANTPAATAADFLYSLEDQDKVVVRVVGDPALLLQGEAKGVTASNITFNGFYPDGTVCPETQQIVFAMNFNTPSDYNLNTGLMDINSLNTNGNNDNLSSTPSQASAAFILISVKNSFSKGRFEQELTGTGLKNLNTKNLSYLEGRQQTNTNTVSSPAPSVRASLGTGSGDPGGALITPQERYAANGFVASDTAGGPVEGAFIGYRGRPLPTTAAAPSIQPMNPADPATSNGQQVGTTTSNTPPPASVAKPGSLRARATQVPNTETTTTLQPGAAKDD